MGVPPNGTQVPGVMSIQVSEPRAEPAPPRKKCILVVDDSKLARAAIANELASYPYIQIAGEAENGTEGFVLANRLQPDVVLTDLDMPGLDGFQLVERLREKYPTMRLIITSAHESASLHAQSLCHGADDFIPKEQLQEVLPGLLTSFFPEIATISNKENHDS